MKIYSPPRLGTIEFFAWLCALLEYYDTAMAQDRDWSKAVTARFADSSVRFQKIQDFIASYRASLEREGVGIRGANERNILREIEEMLPTR